VPPLVAVPTTAGTGSEVQSFAVLTRGSDRAKVACGADGLMPRVAILDRRLTVSAPPEVTAIAGLDALGHALETAVTTVGTLASRARAREAFGLLWRALPRVLATPSDLAARGEMLRGACLAGQAIEASMLGAAHAAANPLSTRFGLPHGVAVATMLASVIRYNAEVPEVADTYALLAADVAIEPATAAGLAAAVEELVRRILPRRDRPAWLLGKGMVEALGVDAAGQWTGTFNPRAVDAAAFAALYRAAGVR
jgi:alcohol dehydrogenase